MSEIILQQTQVKQGLPYYQRFIKTFPNVHQLAEADEDVVMKMWQGLGYYSRLEIFILQQNIFQMNAMANFLKFIKNY
ncbi:hypothetical protein [Flavobacterium sp. CS20]|uniref:hypothetical protein n=1 Tax=Flavobacterium sp. CS20 TaxID=2775246 RepID=UPI003530419D